MRTPTPIQLHELQNIATNAGTIISNLFVPGGGIARQVKDDATPFTEADTSVNRLVIEAVRKISTYVDIIGEEENARTNSPWQITCDPIDGTFPYTWGMPVSTFMIGLIYICVPVMGVIYDPFQHQMYSAERGKGAFANGVPIHVSQIAKRRGKEMPVVGYASWPGCSFNILDVCKRLEAAGVMTVNFCSIGYLEAAVATGELAATIFPGKKYHDTAPGHPIVEEAGGKVTDIFGRPISYGGSSEIEGHIMSNGKIHDLIVEAVLASQPQK